MKLRWIKLFFVFIGVSIGLILGFSHAQFSSEGGTIGGPRGGTGTCMICDSLGGNCVLPEGLSCCNQVSDCNSYPLGSGYQWACDTQYTGAYSCLNNSSSSPYIQVQKKGPSSVSVGQTASYILQVVALGSGLVTGLYLYDTLPGGFTYISSNVGNLNPPPDSFEYANFTISGGEFLQVVITGTFGSAGIYTNSGVIVSLPGLTGENCISNGGRVYCNSNIVTTTVTDTSTNLSKTASQTNMEVGQPFAYILKVTNTGTTAATNVVVTDPIITGCFTPTASSVDIGSLNTAGYYTWTIPTLNPNSTGTLIITGFVNTPGSCTNIAYLSGMEFDQQTVHANAVINGQCGPASGSTIYDIDNGGNNLTGSSGNLCTTGTVANFIYNTTSHQWFWDCTGSLMGSAMSCSASEARCGDTITQAGNGEQCDDGNMISNDGCNTSCQIEFPSCGTTSGGTFYTTPPISNLCGSGNISGNVNTGTTTWNWICVLGSNTIPCGATRTYCGDGSTQVGNGEQCDFGDLVNGDGCGSSCQFEKPTCALGLNPNAGSSPVNTQATRTIPLRATTTSINRGDASQDTNPSEPINHTYIPNGTYTVILNIKNNLPGATQTNTCTGLVTVSPTPINGQCGVTSGSRYYDFNGLGTSLTGGSPGLCTAGNAINFQTIGHTWTWTCQGVNGGSDVIGCTAYESYCGDNTLGTGINYTSQEQCDDGGNTPNDGCSALCQFETPNCTLSATPNNGVNPLSTNISWGVLPSWISAQQLDLGAGGALVINPTSPINTSYLTAGQYTAILIITNNITGSNVTNQCTTFIQVSNAPITGQCNAPVMTGYYSGLTIFPSTGQLCTSGTLSGLNQTTTGRSWNCIGSFSGGSENGCALTIEYCGDNLIQTGGFEQCDNQAGCNNTTCQWFTGSCGDVGLSVLPSLGTVPFVSSVGFTVPSGFTPDIILRGDGGSDPVASNGIAHNYISTGTHGGSVMFTHLGDSGLSFSCNFSVTGTTAPTTGQCNSLVMTGYYSGINALPSTGSLCSAGTLTGLDQTTSGWNWDCNGIAGGGNQTGCNLRIISCGDGVTQTVYGEQCDTQIGCNPVNCQWFTGSCTDVGLSVLPSISVIPFTSTSTFSTPNGFTPGSILWGDGAISNPATNGETHLYTTTGTHNVSLTLSHLGNSALNFSCSFSVTGTTAPTTGQCNSLVMTGYYSGINALPSTGSLCSAGTLTGLDQTTSGWNWDCNGIAGGGNQTGCNLRIIVTGSTTNTGSTTGTNTGTNTGINTTGTVTPGGNYNGSYDPGSTTPTTQDPNGTADGIDTPTIDSTPNQGTSDIIGIIKRVIQIPKTEVDNVPDPTILEPLYIYTPSFEEIASIPSTSTNTINHNINIITSSSVVKVDTRSTILSYLPKIASTVLTFFPSVSTRPFDPQFITNQTATIDLRAYDQKKLASTVSNTNNGNTNVQVVEIGSTQPPQPTNTIDPNSEHDHNQIITNTSEQYEIDVASLKYVFQCQKNSYSQTTLEQCIQNLPKGNCTVFSKKDNTIYLNENKVETCIDEIKLYNESFPSVKGALYIENRDDNAANIIAFLQQFIPSLTIRGTNIFSPYLEGFTRIEFDENIPNKYMFALLKHLGIQDHRELDTNPGLVRLAQNYEPETGTEKGEKLIGNDNKETGNKGAISFNDPLLSKQTYLSTIRYNQGASLCSWTSSKKISVAIVDSAFDTSHEDFGSNIIYKADIANKDDDPSPPFGRDQDTEWAHGTYSAGIIGATSNNNKGIMSIAGDVVNMFLYKAASDKGAGNDISYGAESLVAAAKNKPQIISLSRGAFIPDPKKVGYLEKIVDKISNQGVLLIASAGNYNKSEPFYPAAFSNVVAVGAVDNNFNKANFSNYGNWVDIAAPGVDIWTTSIGNMYEGIDGTSESAPLVAGIAAWVFSKGGSWDDVEDNLTPIIADIGRGVINTEKICTVLSSKYASTNKSDNNASDNKAGNEIDNETFQTQSTKSTAPKLILRLLLLLLLLIIGVMRKMMRAHKMPSASEHSTSRTTV